MFHIHNETVNIWSHFLGSLIFVGLAVELALQSHLLPDFTALPSAAHAWTTHPSHLPFAVYGNHTVNTLEYVATGGLTVCSADVGGVRTWHARMSSLLSDAHSQLSHMKKSVSQGEAGHISGAFWAGFGQFTCVATCYQPRSHASPLCRRRAGPRSRA